MNPETVNIGEKLKQAIQESRLTWKEIALKTDIREVTLYKLVKKSDIKVSTLLKFAGGLNIPLEFFFGVTETDLIKECKQLLEEERSKNYILTKTLETTEQQFSRLFSIIKEFEKQENPKDQTKLTMVEREGKKTISLSHFFLIYTRMVSAGKTQGKDDMYLKYTEQFLNIIEIREALKQNPFFIPGVDNGIIGEIIENSSFEEFIDVRQIYKKA
jgi:transcriptional regulator with XRE-family HTH domain